MTYHQTISLLAQQLREANATISRQSVLIARQQHALLDLTEQLRALQARIAPAPVVAFPARALRHGSPR